MQRSNTILTRDGTRIWINSYLPSITGKGVLIIAPAAGLTHKFYHLFALYCKENGYTVITFDYRGMGESAPQELKGFNTTIHEWAIQDINAVLLYVHNNYPKQEIIYIGHSLGGEIIGLAPASQYINKMVLVSSAITCERFWPLHYRLLMKLSKFKGRMITKLLGYLPGTGHSEPLPKGVYAQMANWCDSPNGLFDSYPDNNYRKLNVPVLVYTFTDDKFCPPRAVKELLSHFSNATVTWYHLKPKELGFKKVGHSNFFYLGMKKALWHSLIEWLINNKDLIEGNTPVNFKTTKG